MDEATGGWFDREIAGCRFADERLNKRLRNLLERMGDAMGASIPLACQNWANTKAAYRFFSNERFNEAEILAGHFQSTPGPLCGDGRAYPGSAGHHGVLVPAGAA